jgi:outer membrane receptor protein involved in Fe transport
MTMPGTWLRTCLMTAAAAPLLLAAGAHAADASSNAAGSGVTDVGEIVVTATRKEQSLSKVPESVSAFTAGKLDKLDIKSFADLAKFTPGVTFNSDRHDISIRGISSTAGSGTTGIYIDDTPVQVRNLGLNANNTLPTVFDLQRVEILRGPQGTLFGAGSEGGTIRYITTQPSLTTFSGMAHTELAFSPDDGAPSYEGGVAVGGPLIKDVLGFRVSAWARRDGGYVNRVDYQTGAVTDPDANRVDTYVLRGALTWAPTSQLTITPGIDYQKRDQHNHDEYWVSLSNAQRDQFNSGTPDRQADPDRFYLPTLKVEYDAGPVKIISNTSYYDRLERVNGYSATIYNLSYFQHYIDPNQNKYGLASYGYPSDPLGNPCLGNCTALYPLLTPTGPNVPGLSNYYSQNLITNGQQNFTQEVRIQSNTPGARLQWTAGFFFAFDRQQSKEEIRDPELPQLTNILWGESVLDAFGENLLANGDDYINETHAKDSQEAWYLDATYAITSQLKLNVGLRYALTHFSFNNLNDGPQDLLDNGGIPNTTRGGKNEQPFTPKFSLSYQLTSDDLVYATAAKGYRIGGASPPLPAACGGDFPTQYNSDSVWSYEIGTKDRFFNRTLQVSVSGYYIDWSNIQQAFYVPACGIQFTTNAGQAVSKGFDLQSDWQVTRHLSLELTAGYNDAKFSKNAFQQLNPDAPVNDPSNTLNRAGDALDVAPWTVTVAAQYDFNLYGHDGFLRVDDEFQSKRTAPTPDEDPLTAFYDPGLVPNPSVNQVSLRASFSFATWDVAMFCNNLFDVHPQLDLQHQDRWTTLYEAYTVRPRTVGIEANYKF